MMGTELACGVLLGCGLGAFVDGIVLHQILQWHNMLSSVRPPLDLLSMKYNMLYDGLFHVFAWLITAVGVAKLWRLAASANGRVSGVRFAGGLLAGWGGFNTLEGIIDHEWLGLHHVHPGAQQVTWDVGFILSGLAMVFVGLIVAQRGNARLRR